MHKVIFDNVELDPLDKVPKVQVQIVDEVGNVEYKGTIYPDAEYSRFVCCHMYGNYITQSIIGKSGKINYVDLVCALITDEDKLSIIHSEFAMTVIDFVSVISDLYHISVECPNVLSKRYRIVSMENYYVKCLEYFKHYTEVPPGSHKVIRRRK